MSKAQLSFVLPVSLNETRVLSDENDAWRHSPDEGVMTRTSLLLKSFLRQFNQNDLLEFFIVCPDDDIDALGNLLKSVTDDPRYHVMSEMTVCPEVFSLMYSGDLKVSGWYVQQLIKLAISRFVRADFYVTLDSDIICLRPFSYSSLVVHGLALTNVETLEDYADLYHSEFAMREFRVKCARYDASAQFLGYVRPRHLASRFYGETPVVLHCKSVAALTAYIEARFARLWSHTLADSCKWTEYGLYYQYIEMTGHLNSLCSLTGRSGVLDLDKSVWHGSKKYRSARNYDEAHFNVDSHGGLFAAVQSWLPASSWLPARYRTLSEFYNDMEHLLLDARGKPSGESAMTCSSQR